ncbi:tRNA (adenosine(37)-N6)-threonylcarbamoyltransferase complex transferase subunit TsaD [Bacteroidota bacterium]
MCIILALESSCDDTSAAVLKNGKILTNVISSQLIHEKFGGVVPELASRAHQRDIVAVVIQALNEAGVDRTELDAVAFTNGPGLIGSLLVASSFAKGLTLSLNIPLIGIHHLHAHVMANFIDEPKPSFPFLCLLVSGGHTQILKVTDYNNYEIMGKSIDDAAGEAFDKAGKVIDLPYPGGPSIDKMAQKGNPKAFEFPTPKIPGLDFSFSGLKTSFLYTVRDGLKDNKNFIEDRTEDLCASYQHRIVSYLCQKLTKAATESGITEIALAGGVAANSALRKQLNELAIKHNWNLYIPQFQYCTDNAGMIAITAYYQYLEENFSGQDIRTFAR